MNGRHVHGSGPLPAQLLIVGEAPGSEEEQQGRPFVGPSGHQLDTWLTAAGINRSEVRLTNVFRQRPPGNHVGTFITHVRKEGEARGWLERRGAWLRPDVAADVEQLFVEVASARPNLVVTLGATPLWALLGRNPRVGDMRGNLFEVEVRGRKVKVLPTFHPAFILRGAWPERPLAIHDIKRASREMLFPELTPRPEKFVLRPTFQQVSDWCTDVEQKLGLPGVRVPLSVDIETRGSWIACVGFATSASDAICVPFMCVENGAGYWLEEQEVALVRRLRQILCHPHAHVIGANFLFDIAYLQREWLCTPRVGDDIQLMHHTLFSPFRKALGHLVTWYSAQPRWYKAEGRDWSPRVPEEQLWAYCSKDVTYTYEIWEQLEQVLDKTGQRAQYEFMLSLFGPVQRMTTRGLRIDLEKREEFSNELRRVSEERQAWIEKIVGHELNPASHQQLKAFFYQDCQIKPVLTHEGTQTVDEEALDLIALREPIVSPLIRAIKDIRSADKVRGTFVDVVLDPDRRLRCSINLTGAKTFRFSASTSPFKTGTNLQTIPRSAGRVVEILRENGPQPIAVLLANGCKPQDIEDAENEDYILVAGDSMARYRFAPPPVRRLFIPDGGYTLVDMDLERADLYVDAWESGDESLKQLLKARVDIHAENAKVIGLTRQVAKLFIHATHKGGKARTVAQHCSITVAEAERGQQRWFREHPRIREWHQRIAALAESSRPILYNPFGMRFPLIGRPDDSFKEGVAWLAQSVVARVINTALVRLDQMGWPQLLLQVHDSLLFQIPQARDTPEDFAELERAAQVVVPYPDDPLVIPIGFKKSNVSWGDCK